MDRSRIVEEIPELDRIQNVFSTPNAQRGLVALYTESQAECTRNGSCGMEIGMAREKDQGAILKHFLGEEINLELDNSLTEDYVMGSQKISAKHSGGKIGTPVKIKWTSADKSVEDTIESLLQSEEYPHLLLTYLDIKSKRITILCISSHHNRDTIKGLGKDAFTIPKGNSRGIEYSTKAMKELLSHIYFRIDISEADLTGGMNPIQRRIDRLKQIGL